MAEEVKPAHVCTVCHGLRYAAEFERCGCNDTDPVPVKARAETPGEDSAVAHGQPSEQNARDALVEQLERMIAPRSGYTHAMAGNWLANHAGELIEALRTSQPNAAEPVAWASPCQLEALARGTLAGHYLPIRRETEGLFTTPLYAHPPAAPSSQEPWPGCYADRDRQRVETLAKLGLMLSIMAGGEASEVEGFDASALYAEVLMALGIEDADDTDVSLEIAREFPEGCVLFPSSQDAAEPADVRGLVDLSAHFPSGLRSTRHVLTATGEVFESPIQCECHCGASFAGTDEQEVRQLWAEHVAALSPTGEAQQGGEG